MRKFWVVITLGLVAYLMLPLPGLSAPLPKKIEQKRQQVERKRAREGVLTETISGYSVKIRSLQGDIRGYADRERQLQGTLAVKRAEVQRVQDRLQIARDRLAKLRARLNVATDALAGRLVAIYKDDEPDAVTVVLESNGFADMLDRTAFLQRISEQDQRAVTQVRVLKQGTTKLANSLTDLERQKQAAADAIQAQKDQVTQARTQLVSRQSDLADARGARRAILTRVRGQRVSLEGDLRSLEQEQARVQARIRAAQLTAASSGGGGGASVPEGKIKRGSGNLIWPVNGPIVSPFGMRWGRLHAGVDIAVPSGTPVHAAAAGRVIIAGWVGGYGNYVCIAHSGSLSTCYGHNSSLGVSQGQTVSQGQVISSSGCTGHCFGPHVHFETRINGSPVDPMGYL
jgi:murein DD-endopeptidase MepM/ murein hydrolase activator NlpD